MQIANSYPASRKEAKRVGSKYYFTGVPCVRGQVSLTREDALAEHLPWLKRDELENIGGK